MEVRACKNCRRLFHYIYGPELCPECIKLISNEKIEQMDKKITVEALKPTIAEDESKYVQVKDYIMNHKNATIIQISEANDIPPKNLLNWIREERLEFSEEAKTAWLECEKCGKKIKTGRLCNQCKNK